MLFFLRKLCGLIYFKFDILGLCEIDFLCQRWIQKSPGLFVFRHFEIFGRATVNNIKRTFRSPFALLFGDFGETKDRIVHHKIIRRKNRYSTCLGNKRFCIRMFQPKDPVVIESYLSGEHSDSSVTRTLLTKDAISKDDVLFAAVTRK